MTKLFEFSHRGASRSVQVNLENGHVRLTLFGKKRDSDNIPMRQAEWEVYLGNRMLLGNLTLSHVKHPESTRSELKT